MVKMKNISKKLMMVMLAAMLLLGSQTTAFAYVDQGTETTQSEEVTEESKTETVLEDEHTDDGGSSFSVPGNAEVLDDISDDSSKEFLTVTTKNNNTFYIVIDRSASTENVYMLSQIDENDLKDFLAEEVQEETQTPGIVLEDTHTEEEETEPVTDVPVEEEKNDIGKNAGLLSILVLAGVGVGAYYYFKIRKDETDEDDSRNEGMETQGTDEEAEETVNEDEEAEKAAQVEQKK